MAGRTNRMDPMMSQLHGESQLKAVASLPPHVESLQHEQQLEQRGMLLNLDLEAALGGLKAGTVTPKQAAGVMHGLIRVEVDAKIAELRQEFAYETMQIAVPAAPAALEHPPLKIYLSEAPTNWHHGAVFPHITCRGGCQHAAARTANVSGELRDGDLPMPDNPRAVRRHHRAGDVLQNGPVPPEHVLLRVERRGRPLRLLHT